MNRSITFRYISVLSVLLSAFIAIADCYINSAISTSMLSNPSSTSSTSSTSIRKKNVVKKNNSYRRKFANENEKYLYGNYLVTLRKLKRTINCNKIFNNMTELTKDATEAAEAIIASGGTGGTSGTSYKSNGDTRDIKGIADDIYFNIMNNTIINNDQYIAKSISLANIKIDVSTVKYIQISTKNDTITIELDKNNDNLKNTDNGFINYDLGKIDSLISAISILMNLLNIH